MIHDIDGGWEVFDATMTVIYDGEHSIETWLILHSVIVVNRLNRLNKEQRGVI